MKWQGKGAAAEREVLALLTDWWRAIEPGIALTRTPGSGGWHHAKRWGAKADLMVAAAPRFPFAVEVKRREGWTPERLLAGRRSPVWAWWLKTIEDAETIGGKVPQLWVRRNRQPWHVLMPQGWLEDRLVGEGCPPVHWWPLEAVEALGMAPHQAPALIMAPDLLASDPALFSFSPLRALHDGSR